MIFLLTMLACDTETEYTTSSRDRDSDDEVDNLGGQEGEAGGGTGIIVEEPTEPFTGGSTVDPGFVGANTCDLAGTALSSAPVCAGAEKVWLTTADGSIIDYTDVFSAGTPGEPAEIEIATPGELTLCGGTWYVRLEGTDLDIVAPDGPEATVLDGSGEEGSYFDGILTLDGTSSVSGVIFQNNLWSSTINASGDLSLSNICFRENGKDGITSGIIQFDGPGALRIEDTAFVSNTAIYGVAVYLLGGYLVGQQLHFSQNMGGHGILFLENGTEADLSAVSFVDNGSEDPSLALRSMISAERGSTITLRDSLFSDNWALFASAVTAEANTDLTIEDVLFLGHQDGRYVLGLSPASSTHVSRSSFLDHESSYSGAVYINGGTFEAEDTLFQGNASYRPSVFSINGSASVDIRDSAVIDNVRTHGLGAFSVYDLGSASFSNVLFSGNGVDFAFSSSSTFYDWEGLVTASCAGGTCK